MNHEQKFFNMLTQLAKLANAELGEEIIEIYDKSLAPLGYENLCRALGEIIADFGDTMRFPTVNDIRKRICPQIDDQSEAMVAAAKIVEARRKIGANPYDYQAACERARAMMGELAWSVVQALGGWQAVCELRGEPTILLAQFRDLARAMLMRHKAGASTKLPGLPQGQPQLGHFGSQPKATKATSFVERSLPSERDDEE